MKTSAILNCMCLTAMIVAFSACSSTNTTSFSADPASYHSSMAQKANAEDETKMLNEQSKKIISSVKKTKPHDQDDTFKAGDQISVQVWLKDRKTQFKGYPSQQTIPLSGEIFLPDVGAINVLDMSSPSLKVIISSHFEKTLKDPTIMVERTPKVEPEPSLATTTLSQTADRQAVQMTQHVIVMGWVGQPGIYPLEAGLTIRDAIALSGQLNEDADKKRIYLVRGSVKNPEIARINLNSILTGKDLGQNIILKPNDAIYVPPVKMWTAYDYIRTALLPISAVRDAVWVGSSAIR